MAKTNIQRKMDFYERFIKESKESPHSDKYDAVSKSLEELMELSKTLKDPGIKLSKTTFEALTQKYNKVQKACIEYLKESKSFNSFESSRKGIIQEIGLLLNKDMAVLEKYDPSEPCSLSEIIEKSRKYKVSLSSSDLKKVGAALSSRIPLKTHSRKKGFFTPNTYYQPDMKWKEKLEKHIDDFKYYDSNGEIKDALTKIIDESEFKDYFCTICPSMSIEQLLADGRESDVIDAYAQIAYYFGLGKDEETNENDMSRAYETVMSSEPLKNAINNFIKDMAPLVNQRLIMQSAGISVGSNISNRNCAMTDIAKMLGCEGILANSVPMQIEIDGEIVDGVFMESVEGTDVNRLKEDDIIFYATDQSFENAQALNQLTDLQVLDFICGNVDRHDGNMIYQFGKDDFGNVILTGIKGIDNDCSLGTPQVREGEQIMKMVNPEHMQCIRRATWNKILLLTPEKIQFQLQQYELNEDELNAILERVENVKEAVKGEKIWVVEDDHWEKYSLNSSETWKGNYFQRMQKIASYCKNEVLKNLEKGNNDIEYVEDTTYQKRALFNNKNAIKRLRAKMDKAKSIFYDSEEFQMMESCFVKIEKLTNNLDKYESAKEMQEDEVNALKDAYKDLAVKTKRYIKLKKLVPYTGRGLVRQKLAQELQEFAEDTFDDMRMELELDQAAVQAAGQAIVENTEQNIEHSEENDLKANDENDLKANDENDIENEFLH